MWYRLTLALGHKSVSACQEAINSREFTGWLAYYSLEPFGYEMENLRFGTIASAIYNAANPKNHTKPQDFFKRYKPQSLDQQLAFVAMLNEAFGGEDLRQDKSLVVD